MAMMARGHGNLAYRFLVSSYNLNVADKINVCDTFIWSHVCRLAMYSVPSTLRNMATKSTVVINENHNQELNNNQLCEPAKNHYRDAVMALNSLQSNAETIRKSVQSQSEAKIHNIPNMINYLHRVGLTLEDVDGLSVIHVTGTKGKGSTCAFVESILCKYGYKTGLYSSPHLIEVRERIRINGQPISYELFSNSFWPVFEQLQATKDGEDGGMPHYFSFLTVMAMYVFVRERVDVAVLEVGIGGQYDSTNIVQHPVVCGISSLDFDHTNLLGHTLESIAWHKAGIFKCRTPAFTVHQPECSMQVLLNRAVECQCPLSIAAPLELDSLDKQHAKLGIAGSKQLYNAGLAVQLCMTWLAAHGKGCEVDASSPGSCTTVADIPVKHSNNLTQQMIAGLCECNWPGRNQTIYSQNVTYYLDGAHTPDSIKQCVEWFREAAAKEEAHLAHSQLKVSRVLIFNMTGDRPVASLLAELQVCDFHQVAFCPNLVSTAASDKIPDQIHLTVEQETITKKSKANLELWKRLDVRARHRKTGTYNCCAGDPYYGSHDDEVDSSINVAHDDQCVASSFPCITSAVQWSTQQQPETHTQVLVTGSLHLVGGVLRLIAPTINH